MSQPKDFEAIMVHKEVAEEFKKFARDRGYTVYGAAQRALTCWMRGQTGLELTKEPQHDSN